MFPTILFFVIILPEQVRVLPSNHQTDDEQNPTNEPDTTKPAEGAAVVSGKDTPLLQHKFRHEGIVFMNPRFPGDNFSNWYQPGIMFLCKDQAPLPVSPSTRSTASPNSRVPAEPPRSRVLIPCASTARIAASI